MKKLNQNYCKVENGKPRARERTLLFDISQNNNNLTYESEFQKIYTIFSVLNLDLDIEMQ